MIEKFSGSFKNESQGFTVLLNQTIQSIKEFDLLGLYTYLASKPNIWEPNVKELCRHTGYSKDKIYRLINGLMAIGYLSCKKIRSQGKFVSFSYTLHLNKLPFPENQEVDSPFPEKPDTVNQDTYKRKNLKNKDINIIYDTDCSNSGLSPFEAHQQETAKERKQEFNEFDNGSKKIKLTIKDLMDCNPLGIPEQLLREWMAIRGKPITVTVWNSINKQLKMYGKDSVSKIIEGFEQMLRSDWMKNKNETQRQKIQAANEDTSWGNCPDNLSFLERAEKRIREGSHD